MRVVVLPLLLISAASASSIHTVFTTECSSYFTWQSLGFMLSYKLSAQPGRVTRLLSCTEDNYKRWQDDGIIPTHLAPSWTVHPKTGDIYSGINKPVAVLSWYMTAKPTEDYIIIVDADMIIMKPFDPVQMGVKPGWAVSAFFGYLRGVKNEMALKHVPHVQPRNDSLAGPEGRRGDQVGGFTIFQNKDLGDVLPLWIKYTEDVRADPDAWNSSGDSYTTHAGMKPWIAEMYGYSFGCSSADVWHHTDHRAMLYPGYMPYSTADLPNVLHYGLLYGVEEAGWQFDKHWYQEFDALVCPPWAPPPEGENPTQGLFPFPPQPSTLTSKGEALLRDLLAIHVVAHLNEALCLNYRKMCPASTMLSEQCDQVDDLFDEVVRAREAVSNMALRDDCHDFEDRCAQWASKGECSLNPNFMLRSCKKSCSQCSPSGAAESQSAGSNPVMEMRKLEVMKEVPVKAAGGGLLGESVMSQKDSLAMATSAVQRQQGAGHALPADKATPHEQTQEAQDAAKGTQSAVLKERGSREAARQVEVDAESAALQKPETQEAVKQVQVDAESAQLQKPETQQAVERAAEKEQLQQGQDLPGAKHSAGEIKRQDAPGAGVKRGAVEEGGEAGLLQGRQAPVTGIKKFKHDREEALQQQEKQRQERRCLANPSLTLREVQECLDALTAGKEWQSTRQPQSLEDGDEAEAMLAPLHQGMSQGDVIHEKDSRGLLDFVMGSAFGKGAVVVLLVLLLLKAPWRKSKQSPLLKVYRHD
ncbi:hypothetical protein CVIRNUC_010749 [Coccomyxa viridis]|uniref:ShKT domain-containing protein n=1 Tax=Coccomyxa viridis TaxID=1274662 RepID=A0AAV1IJL7_9CHLO|nr:hypothetical protein CVIRNUC_010749 [Coccomyxa viridis]